ncbi:Membrane-bound lytic murein transglycosylase C [Candidatus Providencia siddallii]|uniref:peptidoglycan lytic exotransglycosylase n=1 Tax=Candidatus Providencia siddallii TaxID=1715285 RepID=A0A0M6W928_9GAMM|nr:Membrane-bound lytic murein transglycosylase C [Candidatus Providencia siddallii]
MKKIFFLVLLSLFIVSCSSNKKNILNETHIKDTKGFNILIEQLSHNVESIWGPNEVLLAGQKDYVKYINEYKTRISINFDIGLITIESISVINPLQDIKKAIVTILMMKEGGDSIEFFYDKPIINYNKEPFLFGQILDNFGEAIRWEWHAERFAQYIIKNKIKYRKSGNKKILFVTIKMISNHLDKRVHNYISYIKKSAIKYGVDQSLILAIMQVESSFNPYAVSSSDALGLMQIMPSSAGKDVFRSQGKSGIPSRSYLFDPEKNIDIGVAYLAMLQNTYLGDIRNQISNRYAVISAYNGGAGSVLRVFHSNKKQATEYINKLNPGEVYKVLSTKHPIAEARDYLIKVNKVQKNIFTKFKKI